MGRGGGGHHSSHHHSHRSHYRSRSHYHSHSSGSSSSFDLEEDSLPMCIVCGFIFVVFLGVSLGSGFGAIATSGNSCSNIYTLNRNEQAFCKPKNLNYTWIAETYGTGKDYAKAYRASQSSLPTTNRTYKWMNYKETLFYSYSYFTIASPLGVSVDLSISTDEPEDLKVFFLTKYQFDYATYDDEFSETMYPPIELTQMGSGKLTWQGSYAGNNTIMYLVFSSNWHHVSYIYDVAVNYLIYDVSSLKPAECTGKCEFTDMKKDEIIVLDYKASTTSADCSKKHGPEPDYFDVWLHDNEIDWMTAGILFGLFGLIALGGFCCCSIYFVIYLKHKIGSKASKVSSVSMSSVTTTDTSKVSQPAATPGDTPGAVAQATPDPAVAAAAPPPAYPVDPAQSYGGVQAYSDPNMNTEYPFSNTDPSAYATDPSAYATDPSAYPTDPSTVAPV